VGAYPSGHHRVAEPRDGCHHRVAESREHEKGASWSPRGDRANETIGYSATVFFLSISTVTEMLTRLPPSAPVVAGPEAPIFKILYLGVLILFLICVTVQVRRQRIGVSA